MHRRAQPGLVWEPMALLNWLNVNPGAAQVIAATMQLLGSVVLILVTAKYVGLTHDLAESAKAQVAQREREFALQETPRLLLATPTAARITHVQYDQHDNRMAPRIHEDRQYKLVNLSQGTIFITDGWAEAIDENGDENHDVAWHVPVNALIRSGEVYNLDPLLFARIDQVQTDLGIAHYATYYPRVSLSIQYRYSKSGLDYLDKFEIAQRPDDRHFKVKVVTAAHRV